MIDTVNQYAPNFKAAVLGRQIMSPLDLERTFGLIGGDIFHGALSLDQMFSARPMLGYGNYRGPLQGLYMCGAGTHPGGGVTGAPGHNAAREIVSDFRRRNCAGWPEATAPRGAGMAVTAARAASKPRYERQLPEQRRQALIEATIECLKRFGHEGLSIRTISAQAKVSVGLINHHFPNKDELVADAYRHFNSRAGRWTQGRRGARTGPRARACRPSSRPRSRHPTLTSDVLAVWVVFWGMYRHSTVIQRVHSETYQGYVELMRGMLAELLRESRPRTATVDLRLAAIGLTALLDGLWLEWCLEPGTFRPTEAMALCEAWVDNLVRRAEGATHE